jgi:prepilin-type N-terminal cleavage/methylation domain-containing protein
MTSEVVAFGCTSSSLPGSHASPVGRKAVRRGFTLVEIVVAMGIMVLFVATSLASMTQFNRYAMASRLRAHALSLAQQRIDEVLTTGWSSAGTTPAVLAVGTRTENNLVLNADDKNKQAALKSLFTDLVAPVTGTRTTTITSISTRLVRADVTVTFTYAKRTYTIALTTMRATDTI